MPDLAERLRGAGCVYAEEEARVLTAQAANGAELEAMVALRCTGVPLEYVVGWAEFCGLRITVAPGVFIPRRRTEVLARRAIDACRPGGTVVDLCCGSGAIAAAIAANTTGVRLHAADLDPAAVQCARANLGSAGTVHRGDLWDALPTRLLGGVDLVVANAPYIPSGQIRLLPAEAREHEHLIALDGGGDGLAVHRRLAAGARRWLVPGGRLLIEVSHEQSAAARRILASHGFEAMLDLDREYDVAIVAGELKDHEHQDQGADDGRRDDPGPP